MKLIDDKKFLKELKKLIIKFNRGENISFMGIEETLSKHLRETENIIGIKIGKRKTRTRVCATCNQAIKDCEDKC